MSSEPRIRLVIVDDNVDARDQMSKLVMFERDIEVVGTAGSGTEALEVARKLQPDVMLMDINMPDMDGIKATELITSELPNTSVIMMSVQGEQDYLRRSMLAGARQFLTKPFTTDELVESIRQVYRLEASKRRNFQYQAVAAGPAKPEDGTEQGRIIAIYSPKGGVGRTTIATNLAVALKQTTNKKVALVDGSFFFGDVGVMLHLPSQKTIIELVTRINELDEDLLRDVLVSHASGVKVLLAPLQPQEGELVQAAHVTRILQELRHSFDYVIVDTWPSFAESVLAVTDMADRILLVMTLELPAIKNTKSFLDICDKLGYQADKVMLVLNRADSSLGIRTESVEDTLRKKIAANICSDGRAVTTSVNQGVPLVISGRDSQFSKDVMALAKLIASLQPVATEGDGAGKASPKKQEQAPSLLSRFLPARR
ncbi:MAG TPA: response regulator [Chloroflexia bacterium]|jgi:pilus assembly protein CpaE|nr:response regulator [Chloroflexia bacterium]